MGLPVRLRRPRWARAGAFDDLGAGSLDALVARDEQACIGDLVVERPTGAQPGAARGRRTPVGETTLVEHVLAGSAKPTVRINLERDSLDRMAFDECRDFAAFQDLLLDRHGLRPNADQILFIDEVQESRTLGGFVRFMKEEWPRATVILSGSTLRRLFRPLSAVHTIAPAARTPLGAIIENQAAIELARGGQPLAGWKRSPAGSEIDFIVKTGPATVPVECKASLSVNLRHMRGLISYLRCPRPAPRIHREPGAVRGNERGRCADRESACLSPGAPRECNAVSFWRPALRGP